MFSKVLIANRGAIATRIMRTLRKMNISSVAVYSESDADSLHVRKADEAFSLGDGPAADTYLQVEKILAIAKAHGVEAIHPGYGFLSENADFVRRCEAEGLAFIGPTAQQMETFGLKHTARSLAQKASVPLLPGSALLTGLPEALTEADNIGYPIMLKSTAGGGGIGMQLCHSKEELEAAFETVKRLGANHFADDGVFIEKFIAHARHLEVQIFGDGQGQALAIGERDCSSQRRNQKVVEECPAPNLSDNIRSKLHKTAETLLASVDYRNAGTVEFIFDTQTNAFYFLEVNTRLQVEHGVTEEVYGIDLVEWMLRCAAGEALALQDRGSQMQATGHAIQVRVYAEDPYRNFQPCAGHLTQVYFPKDFSSRRASKTSAAQGAVSGLRIDHWIEAGVEVSPYFDPMLAKVIVLQATRSQALQKLQGTLDEILLYGCETNLDYLRALSRDSVLAEGRVTTRYLNDFPFSPARVDVLQGGTQTTLQDSRGRQGYWHVGVPPSGPFDSQSFRLANRLLQNPDSAAGLEIILQGPTLQFSVNTKIVLAGAPIEAEIDGQAEIGGQAEIDGQALPLWEVIEIKAGDTLRLGLIKGPGARTYLCIEGGFPCPEYLGSRSTFTLGQFGGHNGRALRTGDVLHLPKTKIKHHEENALSALPAELRPEIKNVWQLRVVYGPHGAPDFFTEEDIHTFFQHQWQVHYNSSRTGIRLIGPKPQWARKDGGEAGLHPSNIHDNAYAFGTIDFTGDMPVILGPDGPSLGGFVCPATVVQADLWKLGQLRAGDSLQFISVSPEIAKALEADQLQAIKSLSRKHRPRAAPLNTQADPPSPILDKIPPQAGGVQVVYRGAGDHFLLVEYGEQTLDIVLRFRAHALMQWLQENTLEGMRELTPGIRSLQVHYNSQVLAPEELIAHLKMGERHLATQLDAIQVPSRIVHLPLSWDDKACRTAVEKYQQSVRQNAPWCPSNLEFIRRINGLESIDAVKEIVFSASYLVMGLGDVYLGAPVATPVDPRHRLVTTKYNPARTWTAENSVGIGGSYLCVYGMEGPGGYQFIGRTLQMWNRYRQTAEFQQPWLLRFFDQIQFYEVSHETLAQIRKDFPRGHYPLDIEHTHFSLPDYQKLLRENAAEIEALQGQRQKAFDQELAHWHATGQFNFEVEDAVDEAEEASGSERAKVIESPVSGSVWKVEVTCGAKVRAGQCLMILESMKMEIPIYAPDEGTETEFTGTEFIGTVSRVLLTPGQRVNAGQALVIIEPVSKPSQEQTDIGIRK